MYEFIRGRLVDHTMAYAIIEAHGVGYKVFIPVNISSKLPIKGQETILFTSFVIRENSQALYGFITIEERDLFDRFLSITGIGPKTALSIIGHLDVIDLASAVQKSDLTALCKVPGIGKKSAERIMLEIKDKLPQTIGSFSSFSGNNLSCATSSKIQDAMNALINLGYTQAVAEKALKQSLNEDHDLATMITEALKRC